MDKKHLYFETLFVILFIRMFSLILKKKLNNYIPRLGNYEISQKKSFYNVFSGTGAKNGGIAQIYIYVGIWLAIWTI